MNIDATLAETIRVIREASGLAQLDLDILTKGQEKEFRISQGYLSNIERKHQVPSIFKLLSLARLCEVPLSRFLKPIGATDAEICGHHFTPEEQEFIDLLKKDSNQASLHHRLRQVLEHGTEEEKKAIETLIVLAAEKASQHERESRSDATVADSAKIIRYRPKKDRVVLGALTELKAHEYDEPQPVVTARLPYFEHRIPAGPPDEVEADGYQTVEVLRHLAKESRYVVRVAGDSMEPEICDGDLLLVDYAEEARSGKIVCALVNGKGTVKRFAKRGKQIVLKASNPKHKDIPVGENDELRIQGVVRGIVERRL